MTVPRHTLLNAAYDHVRAAILDGSLTPGSRVTVRPLTEQLGLSPTPIKAALAALERQGFLVAVPHRGYFVPEGSTDDLLELYELREALDGIAARRTAGAPGHDRIADQLERLLARQRKAIEANNLQSYGELDLAFHRLIWEGSGSRRLIPIAENLIAQVRMGNRLSAQAPGRLPVAVDEHEAILAAIRDGDPRAAERHTRDHVRAAGQALRRYLGVAGGAEQP
ncbi:transcriptional regulator, GntR family [Streptomyces sp. DvalAA-14]|uniref:GntR family transcriptional regulator n=1 Tax=unclassified Streptomyces TaxID=2593676 RepID=UPI00081B5A5C|nr:MULTISPECIES: GntR family transcriptional regulator [unclassified Streptomyces]MYS20254.1 FCD domain-containing protein [Streptomyces sp. SID4948]SCD64673.1 transcriptional regulator, GntR family [Streptomyces sp. DvalAA-14]